jgi:hypothetical protein
VASTRTVSARGPGREREFSPLFFDPVMLSTFAPQAAIRPQWKARVEAADDPMLKAARGGTITTYIVLAVAAMASVVGMLLSERLSLPSGRRTSLGPGPT